MPDAPEGGGRETLPGRLEIARGGGETSAGGRAGRSGCTLPGGEQGGAGGTERGARGTRDGHANRTWLD